MNHFARRSGRLLGLIIAGTILGGQPPKFRPITWSANKAVHNYLDHDMSAPPADTERGAGNVGLERCLTNLMQSWQ